MEQMKFSRKTVTAVGAAFFLLLAWGFWWKLNPTTAQHNAQYYRDVARLQAEEAGLQADDKGRTVQAPVSSDKAYQPESGHIN